MKSLSNEKEKDVKDLLNEKKEDLPNEKEKDVKDLLKEKKEEEERGVIK